MKNSKSEIDWLVTCIPIIVIVGLCVLFIVWPKQATDILDEVRNFLGNELGFYYILIGGGVFCCSLYIAFSKIGRIRLGEIKTPQFSNFKWGTMIFTSTMAADILFYSLCEWALYAGEDYVVVQGREKWAATYPLFHWGPIPWGFYLVLAAAFGFMLHVKGGNKQKFSEACRPLLGGRIDGIAGKIIDLIAVFALLAGTATTFSLATPLLSKAVARILGIESNALLTVLLLATIAVVYTSTVWFGMKGISKLAGICTGLFASLLLYVFIGGGEGRFIIETGISSLGNMVQNFIGLTTWMDPMRESSFPQNWTIFYWAYWMVWCVATPFFIGSISKGRTIRNTILGGYAWGIAGTYTSFIILGNYGLAKEAQESIHVVNMIAESGDIQAGILAVFNTLPFPKLGMLLLIVTMIAFYATTFDALTMVISSYSYKELKSGEEPGKRIRIFWAILFILFPIALIFHESSMKSLQSVSIIAAFPIGIVILMIIISFFREVKKYF